MAKSYGVCFKCLMDFHPARNCKLGKLCDVMIEGKGLCNQNQHPLLHFEQVEGTLHKTVSKKTTLLNISTVYSMGQPVDVLWDSGSDISLITHSMANKLGLRGKCINVSMIKVGNVIEKLPSKEYCIPLTDKTGSTWYVDVVGICAISVKIEKVDLSKIPELFMGI